MKIDKDKPYDNQLNQYTLSDLPAEILLNCFSFLDSPVDLVMLTKTNIYLRSVALEESLWLKFYDYIFRARVKVEVLYDRPSSNGLLVLNNGYLVSYHRDKFYLLDTLKFKIRRCVQLQPVTCRIVSILPTTSYEFEENTILAIAKLPNKHIALGCRNGTIEIWRISVKEHSRQPKSNTQNKVKHAIKIQRVKVLKPQHRNMRCNGISTMAVLASGLIACFCYCESDVISIWDVIAGKCIKKVTIPSGSVEIMYLLDNGKFLIATDPSKYPLLTFDPEDDFCYTSINWQWCNSYDNKIKAVKELPNNMLTIATDKYIKIIDMATGAELKCLQVGNKKIGADRLVLMPSGHLGVLGYSYRFSRASKRKKNNFSIWDLNSGKSLYKYNFFVGNYHDNSSNYSIGEIAVLDHERLVCAKKGTYFLVFHFQSIPENRLSLFKGSQADKHNHLQCLQM